MYSSKVMSSAQRVLSQRRQSALVEADRRRERLVQSYPELETLERQLGNTGAQLVKAAMSGDAARHLVSLREHNLELQELRASILRHAGLPANYLEPPFTCSICQDTGFAEGRRCACLEGLLKAEAYKAIPALGNLGEYSFSTFSLDYYGERATGNQPSPRSRMAVVLDKCRRMAQDFTPLGESLLLIGRTGLGKTHLSLAVAGAVVERGYSVVYTSAQGLCDRAERNKFGRDVDGEDGSFLRCAEEGDLLVLDDLGSEFVSQLSTAVLFNLINTRLLERRRTIISTNLSPDDMQTRYSERMVSRLLCGYTMLYFDGEDVRQQKIWRERGME